MSDLKKITHCRICKKKDLARIFSFGPTPLANAFLRPDMLDDAEKFFPLDVYFCNICTLVQLGHTVSADILFKDYIYVSSTSKTFIRHFENFAADVIHRFSSKKDALIVDIGSNDGILLQPYLKYGYRVLGVEPAKKIAKLANAQGIETYNEFFTLSVAERITHSHGLAKIVTATNVFAHIDDLDEVIEGVKILLAQDGVFIIEAPHLYSFIKRNLFDTVYHEHLSYFALTPLIHLFRRFNMEVFDAEKIDSHGGSLRIFVGRKKTQYTKNLRLLRILKEEKALGLQSLRVYRTFHHRVINNRARLLTILAKLKSQNKTIIGYGAPAKGSTLLNFFGIGVETLEYIVDDSPWKQGMFTPGKRIPVVNPSYIYKSRPDYILILAWNFASSIMTMHNEFSKRGGKFIVPVPHPTVVS